jgi:hypothetical protein
MDRQHREYPLLCALANFRFWPTSGLIPAATGSTSAIAAIRLTGKLGQQWIGYPPLSRK